MSRAFGSSIRTFANASFAGFSQIVVVVVCADIGSNTNIDMAESKKCFIYKFLG